MNLSNRLSTIIAMADPCGTVADVGTDHGFVPIALVKHGRAQRAIAMDVRKGPLNRAQDHIKEQELTDRIETRLSDGLSAFCPGEADTVVIAGMGGELMIRILEQGRHVWNSVKQWILSPQSDIDRMRHYLEDNGFWIEQETMLREDGKYYVIMKVSRGAGTMRYEKYIYYKYGRELIRDRNPVLAEYLAREKCSMAKLHGQLSQLDSPKTRERAKDLERELNYIKEAEEEMLKQEV